MTSTFACCGSVKSRNFVPVRVWKHCRRKFSVSRTSIPDGGSGREEGVEEREVFAAWERGWRRVVKAWTLRGDVLAGCLLQERKEGRRGGGMEEVKEHTCGTSLQGRGSH